MWLGLALMLGQPVALVSVETGYGTVGSALDRISGVSGVVLRAQGDVAREELLVSVSAVSLEDLRGRIAEATDATWTEAGGVWTLVRTAEDREAVAQRDLGVLVAYVTAGMARFADEQTRELSDAELVALVDDHRALKNESDEAQYSRRYFDLESRVPVARFGRSVIRALGAERFARLQFEDRLVFAERPTPRQMRLPDEVGRAWRTALNEQRRFRVLMEPAGLEMVGTGFGSEEVPMVVLTTDSVLRMVQTVQPDMGARGDKTVYRSGFEPFFRFAEPAGRFDDEIWVEIPVEMHGIWGTSRSVELDESQADREWRRRASAVIESGGRPERALYERLGRGLLSAGRDVVLSPGQGFGQSLMNWTTAQDGTRRFDARTLFTPRIVSDTELRLEGDWILGRPLLRGMNEERRADAEALVEFLRAGRTVTLRDVARFTRESGATLRRNSNTQVLWAQIGMGGIHERLLTSDWTMLRLLGTLSETEWQEMERLGSVSMSASAPSRRLLLERLLYRDPIGRAGETTRVEPTTVFGMGLPDVIRLSVREGIRERDMVGVNSAEGLSVTEGGLALAAHWRVLRESYGRLDVGEPIWFQRVPHRMATVTLTFGDGFTRESEFLLGRDFGVTPRYRLDGLTGAMREEYERALQMRRAEWEQRNRARGEGVAPP